MDEEENFMMLKVADSLIRDAGREIAWIDEETMRELGVSIDDVIEIEGKNIASAIVRPPDPDILFSISSNFTTDLENNEISEDLKNVFKENKHQLSENAKISDLFCMDRNFEKDLSRGIIPKRLKNLFENKRILLSEDIVIRKESDDEWEITDKKKKKTYFVKKKSEKLNKWKIKDGEWKIKYEGKGLTFKKAGERKSRGSYIFHKANNAFLASNEWKITDGRKEYRIKESIWDKYLFSWDNVPGNDSEKLLRYLRKGCDIGWAENAEIHKSDDGKTIRIFKDENSVELMIEKKEKAILKISDGRTHFLKVKEVGGKLYIYRWYRWDDDLKISGSLSNKAVIRIDENIRSNAGVAIDDKVKVMKAKVNILKVAEAYHRDAGRGIARIDAKTMRKLGVVSGDAIEIEGKNIAAAIVLQGYSPDSNKSIIRIDGEIRRNAGVAMDDRVRVKKTTVKDAKRITLETTQPVRTAGGERYIARILKGRPITKGQSIRVEMLGNPIIFIVTNTDPLGVVIPQMDTEIMLRKPREGAVGVPHVTYEDVGGLKREIGMIREMIELPLRHPELFERLGIEQSKGVLLYGPPGTGKTLLAKAVANETSLNFILLDPADIFRKFLGESERNLKDIFEKAEKEGPSIIFIDQIDLIFTGQTDLIVAGRNKTFEGTERRVLAQLLSLMDDWSFIEKKVIVVGATNRIDILDEALKSRFDVKIKIGVPDKNTHEEILQVHTRGMPLANNVNLNELADKMDGFVGADIAALCKKAAMHAIQRILPNGEIEREISSEVMEKLKVTKKDFSEALKFIKKQKQMH
jgi:ATP-dependent 26S proteasome regulatory subunit